MSDIWFISDTHFSHVNIIQYENRPFADIHEMNEHMIEQWNKYVKPGDTIYHLGDVFFGPQDARKPIMDRLNGHKKLFLGNHDYRTTHNKWLELGFNEIISTKNPHRAHILQIGNQYVGLSHYPIQNSWPEVNMVVKNVHGHVHSQIQNLDQSHFKCVSVELTNYAPVHIDTIAAWL